jgi:uncharacterized protein
MFRNQFVTPFIPGWAFLLAIAGMLAVPRFYWMLTGSYNAVAWIFLAMMILPFLLLTKAGRGQVGFVRPASWLRLAMMVLGGGALAWAVYALGVWIYGASSPLNWYVAIKATFMQRGDMIAAVHARPSLFLLFVLPAMIFSPLGEEFFFRGILHETLAERFGFWRAYGIDAALFGLTHIAHYGLVLADGRLMMLFPSVLWWVLLMAGTSLLFSFARQYGGQSLWAAVACHAAFNGVMMWCIFFRLG